MPFLYKKWIFVIKIDHLFEINQSKYTIWIWQRSFFREKRTINAEKNYMFKNDPNARYHFHFKMVIFEYKVRFDLHIFTTNM